MKAMTSYKCIVICIQERQMCVDLTLRELQMLAEYEHSIEEARADLGSIVQLYKNRDYWKEAIDVVFVKERQLPLQCALEHDIFFVKSDEIAVDIPEKLRHESLGFVRGNRLVYAGRLVYPVKDIKGQVMVFCGWDKFEKPKYLDSKNNGYKAKDTTFYGMEKLENYYRDTKYLYVVEGIVCCLYLRSLGLNAIALLGSSITKYVLEILKRFEGRIIFIPDNDIIGKTLEDINKTFPAGEHIVTFVKRHIKRAIVIQSKLAKDVDDTRLLNNHEYEDSFICDLKQVALCPFGNFKTIQLR